MGIQILGKLNHYEACDTDIHQADVYKRQGLCTGRRGISERSDRMRRIARFMKVSREQFTADFKDAFPACGQEQIAQIYDALKLPARATGGSAGYDFFMPIQIELKPGETVKIPTGIRVTMQPEWVLHLYPRSGLGFKYRLQLNNTVDVYKRQRWLSADSFSGG